MIIIIIITIITITTIIIYLYAHWSSCVNAAGRHAYLGAKPKPEKKVM